MKELKWHLKIHDEDTHVNDAHNTVAFILTVIYDDYNMLVQKWNVKVSKDTRPDRYSILA